ncbi:MAG: helix-turn-helix domain-containing protein [Bacteriovoracaceae bacterium]|nr:helix-turn-helix domain-containing protein [Bacteriovoracaceae bacterium]
MDHRNEYNKDHCYQYDVRLKNLKLDLIESGLIKEEISSLKISDFTFSYIDKTDQLMCERVRNFITRHEWLGKMPHRPTQRFIATYKGNLAGVIVMATPNAFSNLLGEKERDLEKLISRGACISWSPKNLASALLMFSIKWMVKNTPFRFFTAYSDTTARELGTIYQACNFTYLGQNSGARFEYFDEAFPEKNWFCDRLFRKTTSYKYYAHDLGIKWELAWSYRDKIFWNKIPEKIKEVLYQASTDHQSRCLKRPLPKKHKYLYILGTDKRETKYLKKKFCDLNPTLVNLRYPKERVPKKLNSEERPLTERPTTCWPTSMEKFPLKKLYSIKEVASMYGISQWLIYRHIKSDPTFPSVNIGIKKHFLIQLELFDKWLASRSHQLILKDHNLPSSNELMRVKL